MRDAKGGGDRGTVLPDAIIGAMRTHLRRLRLRFERERAAGAPGVSLPSALMRKFPNASTQWGWHYLFPAASYARIPTPAGPFDTIMCSRQSKARWTEVKLAQKLTLANNTAGITQGRGL